MVWETGAPWLESNTVDWEDRVDAWLTGVLNAEFQREVHRQYPWSAVHLVLTPSDRYFFKAPAPSGKHEYGLISELALHWPDILPQPVSGNRKEGWLLLPDYGRALKTLDNTDARLTYWERLLPIYAEIQITAARKIQTFKHLGVVNRQPSLIGSMLRNVLEEDLEMDPTEKARALQSVSGLEDVCGALAETPCSTTIDHGDLHDGNLFLAGDRLCLLDWGDANLTHPFCSMLMMFHAMNHWPEYENHDFRRLKEAYLEPWKPVMVGLPVNDLFEKALWVGHAARVLTWRHMLEGTGPEAWNQWRGDVLNWVRRWMDFKKIHP